MAAEPTKKPMLPRRLSILERVDLNEPITKDEILVQLVEARFWMDAAMGKGVFKLVDKFFNIDSGGITNENFRIIETAIIDATENTEQLFMVEDLTAGPAVPYVAKGNAITWGFFVLMTVLAFFCVTLDDFGMAMPPQRFFLGLCILFFVFVAVITLLYEAVAILYVLPTQLIYLDKLQVLGFKSSFTTWSVVMLVISLILHSDVYTTALFVGRVVHSSYVCDELEQHWRRSVQYGVLKYVPIMNSASFLELTMVAWLIMLLQLGYAIAYSFPFSPDVRVGSEVLQTWEERKASPKYETVKTIAESAVYRTFLRLQASHGRASAALAESGRMMSINWHDDDYLQIAELKWNCVRVHQEMRRANIRFVFFALQSILIPNLQITFLGVMKTLHQGPVDWLTASSVILTVTCGLKYIFYEVGSCKKHHKFATAAIKRHKDEAIAKQSNAMFYETVLVQRKISFSYYFNGCFCFVAIVSFIFLLVKAVMAMTQCETGMWNFALWPPNGCVPSTLDPVLDRDCSLKLALFRNETAR